MKKEDIRSVIDPDGFTENTKFPMNTQYMEYNPLLRASIGGLRVAVQTTRPTAPGLPLFGCASRARTLNFRNQDGWDDPFRAAPRASL